MPLNTVTLTWDLTDLGQAGLTGRVNLTPTAVLTDATDHIIIPEVPRSVPYASGTGQMPGVIACDNPQITPQGWGYTIMVVSASGQTIVGPFIAFINYAGGATQDLSTLTPVQSAATMQAYLPLPTGSAAVGQVPSVSVVTPLTTAWASPLANPMTSPGDTIVGGAGGAATRLAGDTSNTRKFYREQSSGGVAQAPVWDILQAGDIPSLPYDAAGAAAARVARAGDTMTGALNPAVVTLTDAATITVNAALGNDFRVTIAGNRTLGNPASPADGQKIIIQVTQDATGTRTLSYGTAYEFSTGLPQPTLSTAAGTTDILGFIYNAAKTKWLFAAFVNGYA